MDKIWTISSPEAKYSENALYYFRKTITLNRPKTAIINITADARYKLWINGKMVSFGPYKSDQHWHHYNTADISLYLRDGENEIYAEVLQLTAPMDINSYRAMTSVYRTGNLAFLMWGTAECENEAVQLKTDESWECAREKNFELLLPESTFFAGLFTHMHCTENLSWTKVKTVHQQKDDIDFGEIYLWHLKKAALPAQKYAPAPVDKKDAAGNYDFGRLVTGFIRIKAKGKAQLKLTYSECYVFDENEKEVKRNRADSSGKIRGDFDIIDVNGECTFETFWFRTFRFIKVEGDVELESITVYETGYPLDVKKDYDFGNETDNKLWEICINTLKCCMHETYEDCPYYEQLQYTMDTYFQMLFTMKLTDDISLVKQGIQDFAVSVTAGDICNSRFPSVFPQYIVGFSMYLIYMLDSLEKDRGEHKFIKQYLGTIDSVLSAYENMKRADGLIGRNEYWNFVDWVDGWEEGVPPSEMGDAITVYNLMYVVALKKAARLCRVFGRTDTATEYEKASEHMKLLVKKFCYNGKKGLYADTDRQETYSQHAQIWAVLADMDNMETQKRILNSSVSLKAKGGFAFSYLTFRAFEKAGVYELSEDLMNQYRALLELDCTTIPETPSNTRSECHAWGAVSINELTEMVLGVRSTEECVLVKPYIKDRTYAKGTVYTRFGAVYVEWKISDDEFEINVSSESDAPIRLELFDGTVQNVKGNISHKTKI